MKLSYVAFGVLALGLAVGAMAQESTTPGAHHHRWHRGGFGLGLCVGQTLAQQSPPVILTQGTAPTAAQRSAIKAAKTSCRAQFKSRATSSPAGGSGA